MDCSVYTQSHDELDFFMTFLNPTSENWFPNKYIEDEIKQKVDKTIVQLAGDEIAYDIRQYIDSLKHDPFLSREN